jgi:hypothetical protein
MLAAWVIFPAILLVLCLGHGLLAEALAGRRLPGALLMPLGMATITVIGVGTTASASIAPLTAPLVAALAILGFVVAARDRNLRPDRGAVIAAVAVFCVFGAPVVLSGEATFAGYIKLDDTATWFALTDRLMEEGRSLEGLPPSSYEATLFFNLAEWYPVGAFVPFGVAAELSGQELAWVFQPYLALLASFTALALWQLLGNLRATPAVRIAIVVLATQAATLFAYALWGGIKELVVAALIGLIAALAPQVIEDEAPSVRSLLPLAIGSAAMIDVLSFGAGPWLLGLLGAAALLIAARRGLPALLADGWRFLICVVPLVAIGLLGHPLLPETTKFLLSSSTDLGNLAGPVSPAHLVGIWPAHDFRVDPSLPLLSGALIALAIAAALWGAWRTIAARDAGLVVALGGAAIGCATIAVFGSAWVAAKSYAIVSPFVLLFAFVGLAALAKVGSRTPGTPALIAGGLIAVGILWSNALGYGGVSLAPKDQLAELETIGERFAGVEPALMTEYQPYGVRHFLREMAPEAASELRRRQVQLADGTTLEKGETADLDRFVLPAILTYDALVIRRSPAASRPPGPYELAWRGSYYDVWLKSGSAGEPLEHLPLGSEVDPAGAPDCAEVMRLAGRAGSGGLLVAAPARRPLALALGSAARSGDLVPSPAGSTYLEPDGAGEFGLEAEVPRSGLYEIWLGGSIRPAATLFVDGRPVAVVRQQLNTPGHYLDFGSVRLDRGPHTFAVVVGGPDLHPGSAGSEGPLGPLIVAPAGGELSLKTVPASRARTLCAGAWDWIEVLPG